MSKTFVDQVEVLELVTRSGGFELKNPASIGLSRLAWLVWKWSQLSWNSLIFGHQLFTAPKDSLFEFNSIFAFAVYLIAVFAFDIGAKGLWQFLKHLFHNRFHFFSGLGAFSLMRIRSHNFEYLFIMGSEDTPLQGEWTAGSHRQQMLSPPLIYSEKCSQFLEGSKGCCRTSTLSMEVPNFQLVGEFFKGR